MKLRQEKQEFNRKLNRICNFSKLINKLNSIHLKLYKISIFVANQI